MLSWRVGASATSAAEIFEDGCGAAERTNNLAVLAILNALYGGVRALNQALALEEVRYPTEAVPFADCTGDVALRAGVRGVRVYGP